MTEKYNIELTILEINHFPTTTGKERWIIETSKGQISCWSDTLVKDMREKCLGKSCDVEISDTGRYKSITNVLKVYEMPKGEQPNFKPSSNSFTSFPVASIDLVNQSIVRQCCLKCAVEIVNRQDMDRTKGEEIRNAVLKFAEEFEEWVNRK